MTATAARLINPRSVASDAAGNVYIADIYYNQIFMVDTSGRLTLFAGSGLQGFAGDGGPATAALLAVLPWQPFF